MSEGGHITTIDSGVYYACLERTARDSPLARVPPDSHIQAVISPLYAPLFLVSSRGELQRCVLAASVESSECRSFLARALALLSLTSPQALDSTLKALAEKCSSLSLASAGSSISFSRLSLNVVWPPSSEALSEVCRRASAVLDRVVEKCVERSECREDYLQREEAISRYLEKIAGKGRHLGVSEEHWSQVAVDKLASATSRIGGADVVDIKLFMPKPVVSLKGVMGEVLSTVHAITSIAILVEPLGEAYAEVEVRRDFQRYVHVSSYRPLQASKKTPVSLILGALGLEPVETIISKIESSEVKRVLSLTAPLHGHVWAPGLAKLKPVVTVIGKCRMHSFLREVKPSTRPYRASSREVAVLSHNTQVSLTVF